MVRVPQNYIVMQPNDFASVTSALLWHILPTAHPCLIRTYNGKLNLFIFTKAIGGYVQVLLLEEVYIMFYACSVLLCVLYVIYVALWYITKTCPPFHSRLAELTSSQLALHQLGLGSLSAVEQPTFPLGPQNQRRGTAVRGRVSRPRPQKCKIHRHF